MGCVPMAASCSRRASRCLWRAARDECVSLHSGHVHLCDRGGLGQRPAQISGGKQHVPASGFTTAATVAAAVVAAGSVVVGAAEPRAASAKDMRWVDDARAATEGALGDSARRVVEAGRDAGCASASRSAFFSMWMAMRQMERRPAPNAVVDVAGLVDESGRHILDRSCVRLGTVERHVVEAELVRGAIEHMVRCSSAMKGFFLRAAARKKS